MQKMMNFFPAGFLGKTAFLAICLLVSSVVHAATPAPGFTLKSMTGENIKLGEQAGNVVMINFWASWCGPCRKEMPLLNDLHNKYEALGFTVLGVNVEEDSTKAVDFISGTPVDFPILFDSANEVSKLYQVDAMPVTVLIDREGKVRYVHQGYKPGYEDKYLDQIRSLLRE